MTEDIEPCADSEEIVWVCNQCRKEIPDDKVEDRLKIEGKVFCCDGCAEDYFGCEV